MARVDWDCARGVGNEGAINGAFDAGFAPEFCSTRRFLGALERARAGSCENAVVHPVRIVEEKAEHDGQRGDYPIWSDLPDTVVFTVSHVEVVESVSG